MAVPSGPHDALLCRVLAVGDWGAKRQDTVHELAAAMASFARLGNQPDMILGLGDNFYPDGVRSVDDARFQTTWVQPFLSYPELNVPWHMVLGNHDYNRTPQAQVDFTLSPHNPRGTWNMPARTYQFSQSHVAFFGTSPFFWGVAVKFICTKLSLDDHGTITITRVGLFSLILMDAQLWIPVGLSTRCVSTTHPLKRH
jgi:hypothetical protein